jgi:hypothetical protein
MDYKLIEEQLTQDENFKNSLSHYTLNDTKVTFYMKKEMTYLELKPILDNHNIESKYNVDSFIDGNEFNGIIITYYEINK